jgi:hypothetical protein
MRELSQHLLQRMEDSLIQADDECKRAWADIATRLENNDGLEEALNLIIHPRSLTTIISSEIALCMLSKEKAAISELLNSIEIPAMGRLFRHILSNNTRAEVVTTNYDRLIEMSAACAEVRVDTMFYGHTIGRIDSELSKQELLEAITRPGQPGKVQTRVRPHVRLSKPHGSLDWYNWRSSSVRSDIPLDNNRQIITPGNAKYRTGYEDLFQQHRTRAINAIKDAKAFLMIGYGFNDDHLEEQMKHIFPTVPAVVLARKLTPNARKYLDQNRLAIGAEESQDGGALLIQGENMITIDDPIWVLDTLLKVVLVK